MENIIDEVRQLLKENIDEKMLNTGQNFFKEKILLYGVRIPVVNNISKNTFSLIKDYPKDEIFNLCEELWQSGYTEDSYVACNWAYWLHDRYTPEDFSHFDKWLNNYVYNWSSCDTLCNHAIGTFIEIYPEYIEDLKK